MGMAFANTPKFDAPSYSGCFNHVFNLDESILSSAMVILKRHYPELLENRYYWTDMHSTYNTELFLQAATLIDLRLPGLGGLELYAPNHFARQLGMEQRVPFPMLDSMNNVVLLLATSGRSHNWL
ncbi:hypothetical protein ACLB2K_027341 [Fragaria x ananassa]